MKKTILIFLVCLISACTPSAGQIATPLAATLAAIPTQTAYPTLTPWPTLTAWPTYTPNPTYTPVPTLPPRVVTATNSPTPEFTPTNTLPPTPTQDPTTKDRGNGFYLIGNEIHSGVWKSNGTGDDCYWAVTTKTGDILDNHFGMSGGTAYIPSGGFQVEFQDCGDWTFLGE
jgi:hypothetical protein